MGKPELKKLIRKSQSGQLSISSHGTDNMSSSCTARHCCSTFINDHFITENNNFEFACCQQSVEMSDGTLACTTTLPTEDVSHWLGPEKSCVSGPLQFEVLAHLAFLSMAHTPSRIGGADPGDVDMPAKVSPCNVWYGRVDRYAQR